jgi:chromosome segregation ATPase
MFYNQNDHYIPQRQKQQDIFAQLRAYRQQLATWNQELADMEQRLALFRQRQQVLQEQIERWHRGRDYLLERMEMGQRKQQEWQLKHRYDDDSNSLKQEPI